MKKFLSIALALLMVCVMLPVVALADDATPTYVAKIGETGYTTLKAAFAAVQAGETITVLESSSGDGIVVTTGHNFTVDFNNCTYTVNANLVGSKGTESQAFQLLKDSTITFKNGTINSTIAKMIIQNYSNLTLENMVIDGTNAACQYTLSNNNGNVVIKDTTISASEGKVAFDVCRFSSYVGPEVTVKGNSVINGKIEVSASNTTVTNPTHKLNITGGTINGEIVKDGNSPDFTGEITGGSFTGNVTEYAGNSLVVTNGTNYYVGATATATVESATSGTFTVVNGSANVDLTVKGGVTVKNGMAEGTVTVNGKTLETNKKYTAPTVIIISGDTTPAETPKTEDQKNPSTGANDFVGLAAAAAVVALLGSAVVLRKK